ncbi:MAG TPA: serine hydrolase domain-containing protein [Gaiellaceae bacterium]|nr:serine hydrolase domain-containing protein [Gaiellaceae bacterium]
MPAPERYRRLVLEAQRAGRLPSVSAGVFRGDELVWSEAIGLADVERGVEASPDTQYAVASITKTFTAVSVLQLRDAGKLDLDDPLSKHLPEGAHGTPTLRRMLAHASGLQREPPGEIWETLTFPGEDELLGGLEEAEQVLPPMAAWHYSNLAYALLGIVVARISGTPFRDYVQERLLGPVGLERTTWGPNEVAALPYFVEPHSDSVRREPVLELGGKGGESGLYSTVGDLARWGAFLCEPDESVLRPSSVAEMHDLNVMAEANWTRGWGLGIELWRRGERIFGGHTGAFPGFLSILAYSRPDRVGAVVLTNAGNWPKLSPTGLELAEAALEELAPELEPWRPEPAPPAEIAPLLGRWWSEGDESIFSWRGGKLEARLADAPPEREPSVFEPEGDDRFRVVSGRERGESLRVVRDERGEVVKLYWATYPFARTPEVFGPPS